MDYLFTYLFVFIEFFCIFLIANRLLNRVGKYKFFELFISILVGSIIAFAPSGSDFFITIASQLSYLIYILCTYKESFSLRVSLHVVTFIILLLCQFIVAIFAGIVGLTDTSYTTQMLCNLFTVLAVFCTCKFIPLHRLFNRIQKSGTPVKLILINSYLIFISLLLTFKINNANVYNNITYFIAIITLIFAINMCILYYDISLASKKQELLAYQRNLPIYEALIQEIRSNQHEYSNRLHALQSLPATCKDYDSICQALSTYVEKASPTAQAYPLLQMNMPLLAASLYALTNDALSKNKFINYSIKNNCLNSHISEYELTDLACILVQNAIEASNENEYIYVSISSTNDTVTLQVRNPVDKLYSTDEISVFLKKGYSSKNTSNSSITNEHGFGLYILHQTVLKFNGSLYYECIELDNKYWIIFELTI